MDFDRRLTGSFFPLLTTFYHYQFRMKKSIELSLDWMMSSSYPPRAQNSRLMHESLQEINDSRRDFCESR